MASDGRGSGATAEVEATGKAEGDAGTVSEEEPVIGGDGRETLARSLSKEEDMLQVQHEPDGTGPIDGGKITMHVGNRTTKSLYLHFYWKGKISSQATRILSGEEKISKTYDGTRWRIVEAHHDSTAVEWTVYNDHGAFQHYSIREKSDAEAEESHESDEVAAAERLARGEALIDELRGSTASVAFRQSPTTDEAYRTLSGEEPDAPSFASLPNPTNYCFLNATVQCLRHTPYLAQSICSAAPVDPTRKNPGAAPLIAGFAALLRRMDATASNGKVTAGDPMRQAFISACSAGLPPDIGGAALVQTSARYQAQQDAGEFLHHLLDQFSLEKDEQGELALRRESTHPRTPIGRAGLPVDSFEERLSDGLETAHKRKDSAAERALLEEYTRRQWIASPNTTRRTAIGALFQGQSLKTTTCSNCGLYSPSSADPFLVEELFTAPYANRSRATLGGLIAEAAQNETPPDFRCDRCRRIGTTIVRAGLVRVPAVYIIRLNRVTYDRYGRESRVSTSIDYPDTLELADSQLWWPDTALDYHGRPCGVRYKLYAVVFHQGATVRTGHYFASVHSTVGTTGRGGGRVGAVRTATRAPRWCCGSSAKSGGVQEKEATEVEDVELVGNEDRWVLADDLIQEGIRLNGPPPQQTEFGVRYGGARSVLLFYRRE